MELHRTQQNLPVNEVIFDSTAEQPLECDVILPDYCPDIQRILNCDVCCMVKESSASGSRLSISGEFLVTILYAGERGEVRSIQHKIPYIRNVELRSSVSSPIVFVNCNVDYVNCRAVSSRRLEVRGAATLSIQAVNCVEEELIDDCSGMGVQLKKQEMDHKVCLLSKESPFKVREELEVGSRAPISQILFTQLRACITDQKVISGRIVTKGELHLCILYEPVSKEEDPQPQTLEYTLPISESIDINATGDEALCTAFYRVTGWELQPKCDLDGEAKLLDLEVQLTAQVLIHQNTALSLVSDCYCTEYEAEFQTKNLCFLDLKKSVDESHSICETISHTQPIDSVLCAWCRIRDQQTEKSQDGIEVQATADLSVLIRQEDGEVQILQKACSLTHNIPVDANGATLLFSPQITPSFVESSLIGSTQVEVKCTVSITGCIYALEHQCAVSEISIDESKSKSCKRDCALTIYYADRGESVWDIAKKYNTSIDGVMEENGLDNDILAQREILLIPML